MKMLGFLLVTVMFFTACLKDTTPPVPERLYDYLNFAHVQGPATATVRDTITFQVRLTGSKACYRLEGYEGQASADKQYDLRAIGSYPNPALGDTASCIGAPYVKDTTIRFTPRAEGKQVFRFYNNTTLYRADTVLVTQ
ncbi:hypothetical protein [Flavihumibacter fluvii]|uniref:hypothetical protein n=1 Tax=Flavihumibacter fluvii TaxID=2838157 RepID=UPI001BDE2BA2|nr:hypothetical protein [Flavihumibacter fluvii]ULQ53299.1 hypothetical protein KJS93_03080 [Flavihumibacter fluvii]